MSAVCMSNSSYRPGNTSASQKPHLQAGTNLERRVTRTTIGIMTTSDIYCRITYCRILSGSISKGRETDQVDL